MKQIANQYNFRFSTDHVMCSNCVRFAGYRITTALFYCCFLMMCSDSVSALFIYKLLIIKWYECTETF